MKQKMFKLILGLLIFVVVSVLAGTAFLVNYLTKSIFYGPRQSAEEAFRWQSEHYDTDFYSALEQEDFSVKSFDGYVLHGTLLKNPKQSDRYVILSHGHTDTRFGSLKYVPTYLSLGFNCIIYDLRGHGENERTACTYGIREGQDLSEIVKYFRAKLGDRVTLGLHGESLGAATTVSSLRYQPKVDFAVADCAFADIENVLKTGWRYANIPSGIFVPVNFYGKLRYGYELSAMRPIDALKGNAVPVFYIHGAADGFILPVNSERLYEATEGKKELMLVPEAGHAESVLTNPKLYATGLQEFLQSLGLISPEEKAEPLILRSPKTAE